MIESEDVHQSRIMAGVPRWEERLDEIGGEYRLKPWQLDAVRRLLVLLADDPYAPTPIREPADAVDAHVADSLSGLRAWPLTGDIRFADLGSGAGFPGLVLAVAKPRSQALLVEATGRKAAWLSRAVAEMSLENVKVVPRRIEDWVGGPVELAVARALAPLPVLVEYAAPLLTLGGTLVAWKGAPDPQEERAGLEAARLLGLEAEERLSAKPYASVRDRRLYVYAKVRETPPGFPRRPGMAAKRPLGARSGPRSDQGDRPRR